MSKVSTWREKRDQQILAKRIAEREAEHQRKTIEGQGHLPFEVNGGPQRQAASRHSLRTTPPNRRR